MVNCCELHVIDELFDQTLFMNNWWWVEPFD